MLSKSTIKYINSLKVKKYRQKYRKFTAEGDKIVQEMLQNSKISLDIICCTQVWADENASLIQQSSANIIIVSPNELKKISSLQTPNHVLAVSSYLENDTLSNVENNLSLVLDTIQDPGNLGTIMRIADWFGIPYVFCSEDSVDIYNSKVVQSSMGAFLRVKTIYTDLPLLFEKYKNIPKYGAVLGGENLFQSPLSPKGFIVIGNESKGISHDLLPYLSHQIEIPKYGGAESLNAAVATGIICAFFKK